jgi:hypothetical protein
VSVVKCEIRISRLPKGVRHAGACRVERMQAALPDADLQRWLRNLEFVEMPLGEVLYESGATLSHVHFPTTAIVSLLCVMENGASAETAVAGN